MRERPERRRRVNFDRAAPVSASNNTNSGCPKPRVWFYWTRSKVACGDRFRIRMKQDIEPSLESVQNVENMYERRVRKRIIRNFVDAGDVPDHRRETIVHSDPAERIVSTNELPVVDRLLRTPKFEPILLDVYKDGTVSTVDSCDYVDGTIHRVSGRTRDPSIPVQEVLFATLGDLIHKEKYRVVLAPEQLSDGGEE